METFPRGKHMASISLQHIYKEYERSNKEKKKEQAENLSPFAVRDFNLEIKDGEFVVLVGPSGCGKSTTLRMIAGLEDISGGELYIDNVLSNNIDASKRNIAMVFQSYALYPHMNSYQNMSYGLKLRKIPQTYYVTDKKEIANLKKLLRQTSTEQDKEEINKRIEYLKTNKTVEKTRMVHYTKEEIDEKVQKAAEILDIKHLLLRKPSEMSGGQRQRVALGRALVRDPNVFLLDEPLSNLDAKLRSAMRTEIVKLHDRVKTTFVYVTHDQVEAMTMGDRIVVMKDGLIQQVGTPSEIFDNPVNTFVAGFIGTPQMNFFDVNCKISAKTVALQFQNKSEIKYHFVDIKKIKDEFSDVGEQSLIMGIRPEHIKIVTKGVDAYVNFVEILGNTTNILCNLANGEEFTITVQERSELKKGDKIHIQIDAKNIHLFNKETNETIYDYESKEEK